MTGNGMHAPRNNTSGCVACMSWLGSHPTCTDPISQPSRRPSQSATTTPPPPPGHGTRSATASSWAREQVREGGERGARGKQGAVRERARGPNRNCRRRSARRCLMSNTLPGLSHVLRYGWFPASFGLC